MPKSIDDVILPERKKSIRNIPIPESRRKSSSEVVIKKPARAVEREEEVVRESHPKMGTYRDLRSSKKKLFIAGGVAAVILVFSIMSLFSSATLSYVPKSLAIAYNGEAFKAQKSGESALLYSVVKLSGDKGLSVPASGEEKVSRKATGTIMIYNNASTEAQKLVENTRFESPEGKIYRISKAVTIPGKKTVSGVSQPGSVEAQVVADVAGEEYNTGLVDWTVPGLKGTPRYTTIYARSKTAMTGGFVGMEKVVKPEELAKAKSTLKTSLSADLLAKAQAEVPVDFVLFPDLSSVVYEDLPQTNTGSGDSVTINIRGHLYGVMFKRSDFAFALGAKKATLTKADNLEVKSYEALKVSFAGAPPADLLSVSEVNFKVTGSTQLLWKTDEVALKSDLSGKKKSELSMILKNYPTISTAKAVLRPLWKTSFPEGAEKITIKKVDNQ